MPSERSLERTPTWAVASVCLVLVVISIAIEQLFHHLGSWLRKKRKVSLYEALQKITMELMLMGCISFLLTVGQGPLSRICVPRHVAHSWHPCRVEEEGESDSEYNDPCLRRGLVQLVSAYGIHQFHIFIFMLAVAHIAYCVLTYALGSMKMRRWQSWEEETKTIEYLFLNDPERFRFARDTSFGRRHLQSWSKNPVFLWIVSFFRQFFASVAKVDYLTLRHGFITAHLPPSSQASFDFNKYIKKSLEEDFKTIVGISPALWASALLFLLTNTHGWYSEYWLPFIPLIIILLVGTKLQYNITKMGTRILENGVVIKGTPVVQPGDDLFWFNSPKFMLFLIHLVLFQNAFQLAFMAWSVYEYHFPSCYHENVADIVIRSTMGVLIQVLCSYVTLPLYALVTQMGSKFKPTIFGESVTSALKNWHKAAKKQIKQGTASPGATPFSSRPASPLDARMSPVYLLQGHNRVYDESSVNSKYTAYDEGTSASPSHHHRGFHWNDMAGREVRMDVEQPPVQEGSSPHQTEISIHSLSFKTPRVQGNGHGDAANQDRRP